MQCEAVRELLVEYALGELAQIRQENVKIHLEACPACQESYKEISSAMAAMDEWKVPSAGLDLTIRTLAALEREREERG